MNLTAGLLMTDQKDFEVCFYAGKDVSTQAKLKSLISQLGLINCLVHSDAKKGKSAKYDNMHA